MRQLTRSWPALAALGAALLFGAVGAGAIGTNAVVGSLWIVLALAQAVFGVQSLRGGRLPSPALTLTYFLIPVLLWAVLIMLAPLLGLSERSSHAHEAAAAAGAASLRLPSEVMVLPLLPLLLASALSLGVAAWAAHEMRLSTLRTMRSTDAAANAPAAGGRFVTGLLVGALAVSALVTPGLAATDAGRLAVPHGEHLSGAPVTSVSTRP